MLLSHDILTPAPLPLTGSQAWPQPLTPPRTGLKHVALLIETSGSYGRGLLGGISKYLRDHGAEWSTFAQPRGMSESVPGWLRRWEGDGILVRMDMTEMADLVLRSDIPVVNLRVSSSDMKLPCVRVDDQQVAELAAQHLLDRGFKNFAFCGEWRGLNQVFDDRMNHFRRAIEKAGMSCHLFPTDRRGEKLGWEEQQDRLAQWIASLPRPIGIMACNDARGLAVLDACKRCSVAVPDDVAVIGVDNDEALCELANPPLSSIDVNAQSIGYEAAALLDRMMSGKKVSHKPARVAPRGVVARRSTDVASSEDEEVSRAVRYIRENACQGLQVIDVLAFVGMSRASLQQRMKQIVGRTIHQEIQRVRLSRVKELLTMSDLTTKQVARESGFASVQYMTRVFRAVTGETPARYRSRRTK